ncbi:1-(5-phosphoribosyl)-5-((5-phosphoribosylamino)methylideneamino)imidazole-4-carboxamide isomerase [Stygiolobus caldivivus]|uniref:1-(5-phosphoribosyl)-5-[(5-phosphoribosylamino)methylideneamino] imidazole-4-carboxamide isomerase n=1 Tax=Stygiolobus caldivivus TaxID=2824673 RepID=A0A8D5U967_9CREN|nr:1-(5-phosphoribosyl)-5-((5-phosphoribosylamino)methylideneamino)imidazole-4-carboxamide isomerase [Stygiolobus caldivivus]BCU71360.1 1-(5-phosphoribosyl)-5-[(5-phosphoribosylamino) methylideneamino] imidazole-4-carboxamide isomerase [Stygiolobus caldivivus]
MTIEIIPSIDISEGKAVKRIRGQRGSGLVLGDPLQIAKSIYNEGYDKVHIVDLDAAEGVGDNEGIIRRICKDVSFAHTQVGGGIRGLDKASRIINECKYVVVSTLPVTDPRKFEEIKEKIGKEKIILSIDYDEQGNVLIKGWKEKRDVKVYDMLSFDVYGFIFTYVPKEGTKGGIDEKIGSYTKQINKVKEYAGGVNTIDDLLKLKTLGFDYAIVGMSFYNGRLRGVKVV